MPVQLIDPRKKWALFACLMLSLFAALQLLAMSMNGRDAFFALLMPGVFFLSCFVPAVFLWCRNSWKRGERTLILFLAVIGPLWLAWDAGRMAHGQALFSDFYLLIFCAGLLLANRVLCGYFSFWHLVWADKKTERVVPGLAAALLVPAVAGQSAGMNGARSLGMLAVALIMVYLLWRSAEACRRYHDAARGPMCQTLQLGLVLALGPNFVLSVVPSMIQDRLVFQPLAGLFLIWLPATLFYVTISDRFIDAAFVTTRVSYCALLAAPPAVALGFAFWAVDHWELIGSEGGADYYFNSFIFVFLSIFIILYIKQYLDYLLRKRLHPKQQDIQTSLNRLLQWMKNNDSLDNIGQVIKREMEASLPVEAVRLLQVRRGTAADTPDRHTEPSRADGTFAEGAGKLVSLRDGFRILLVQNTKMDIMLEGKWKMPRRRLNPDEHVWLNALIGYVQMAVENLANTKDMLNSFAAYSASGTFVPLTIKKMMLRISERERWRLSQKLHDQNMQDQLDLARKLDVWSRDTPSVRDRALLVKFREQILDSVYILRQVINDLHPEFIYRTGLRKALVELFEKVNLRADFTLRWMIDEHVDGLRHEWEMAVYRVVQELLNNAQKHSHARLVTLDLRKAGQEYTLSYKDDGVGMDVSGIGKSFGTMGLPGMIGRVEGFGGHADIWSKKGSGLWVTIRWSDRENDAG